MFLLTTKLLLNITLKLILITVFNVTLGASLGTIYPHAHYLGHLILYI